VLKKTCFCAKYVFGTTNFETEACFYSKFLQSDTGEAIKTPATGSCGDGESIMSFCVDPRKITDKYCLLKLKFKSSIEWDTSFSNPLHYA